MTELPIQNRGCLVTDDVPLPRLMHEGHLNYVARRAIALGLDPLKAIRFCTINPADRLRLYDTGALVPGRRAELMLVEDLRELRPSLVMTGGVPVWQEGVFSVRLPFGSGKDVWGAALRDSLRLERFSPADFEITCEVPPDFQGGRALVNLIGQDGVSLRTKREQREVPLNLISPGLAKPDTSGLLCMTVWNRYGEHRHGTALVGGMEEFSGALALTYGHDSHNLSVYGSDPDDMAAAANALLETHGGICAVQGRKVLALVPLPLAGLLSEKRPAELLKELDAFLEACNRMGFRRRDPLSLLTLLPLAVSMEIRCTDKGLLDVANRRFLPLVEKIEEGTI
jgi:adenine deaminase